MRINLKRIAPIAVGALMIGMTACSALALSNTLADYPAPFVEDGAADAAIVFGENADTTDSIAAFDIGIDLQGKATAGSTTNTATTGEVVNLATDNTKLYFGSALNAARASLTKNEMSTLLTDGKLSDDSGTTYDYSQSITLGTRTVAYGNSGGDIDDPTLYINVGTTATGATYLYKYKLAFDKSVNISNTDVQGNSIDIMGQEYTIGSSSTATILYLYGSGIKKTLNEGESATMTVNSKEYTVEVGGVSDSNTVFVTVNGLQRKCDEGNTYRFDNIDVYIKKVFYLGKDAQTSYAEIQLGAKKLKLQNGKKVKEGVDLTSIKGTNANMTNSTSSGQISGFTVDIAMPKTKTDHIGVGDTFTDPVFGGLKVDFSDITTPLDDAARDKIYVDTDNSRNARVTFTSFLADEEQTITYAHDSNTASGTITARLADTSNYTYHVVEAESAVENEYLIINSGDYGRILQIDDISVDVSDSDADTVTFTDALSGDVWETNVGTTTGNGTLNIDGQTYYVRATATTVQISWGTAATYGSAGTYTSIFPRIKLARGGWLAFLDQITITAGTDYIAPGDYALTEAQDIDTTAGDWNGTADHRYSYSVGEVNYTVFNIDNVTAYIKAIDVNDDGTDECVFNSSALATTGSKGPAILLLEEYRSTGTTALDAICIPLAYSGTYELAIDTPVSTDADFSLTAWTSDSYKQSALTKYGTYTIYDQATGSNYMVTMYYPDEEVQTNIYFAEDAATISPGSSTSGGGSLGIGAAVKDSEVGTVQGKNVIVIGGSCINSVAAKLLGSSTPVCGSGWTDLTGVGVDGALVKLFDNPYTEGKVALLVAGWEGKDTVRASKYVITQTLPESEELKLNTVSQDAVVAE